MITQELSVWNLHPSGQFDFLSIDLNLLRRWNLGLWLVTYFLLMMKKVRERERKREGVEGKEAGRERESESKQENHRERIIIGMKRNEGI